MGVERFALVVVVVAAAALVVVVVAAVAAAVVVVMVVGVSVLRGKWNKTTDQCSTAYFVYLVFHIPSRCLCL
jgi:hypothetical protein